MPLGSTQELKMTDAEFRMFCELVKSRCGLHFDQNSRFLVEKRLARRMQEIGIGSFAAYHFLLRDGSRGEQEFAEAVDLLTTNETYFFREYGQLTALVSEVIPDIRQRKRESGAGGPVSIWSAGCSSGEEPLSVVIMAMEAGLEPGKDFRVYASDISRAVLAKSRRGVYREASFRETSSERRKRYFEEKDGQPRIRDEIKKHVDFMHLNLLDADRISLLGTMDVILCRNVIIYFDLETKKKVMQTFYDKLRPGGYLLLGHSESLISVSTAFELKHLKRDLVYRRPLAGEETSDPWHRIARAAVAAADRPERPRR
jgi:chemotaxis protein methyltransferase CheR